MTKLNQIIAIANGTKTRTTAAISEIFHKLQKNTLFEGINRTYNPKDDDGEKLPPESKTVRLNAKDVLKDASGIWTEMFDLVATQDYSNCKATSDVLVDEQVVLSDVPVTHLLFLEKQLTDINSFLQQIPVLDSANKWTWDDSSNCYVSDIVETTRTKKIPKNHVKYEATKEHPAQVEMFTEDVIVGYWSKKDFSGCMTQTNKNVLLERVRKLQNGVKQARESANSMPTESVSVGKEIFSYLLT